MLDKFLEVAYAKTAAQKQRLDLTHQLMKLPNDVLYDIATGKEKLGYYCSSDGKWLDRFKGTALFSKAVEICKQELQVEMAQQQKREERRSLYEEEDKARDELNVQKKLLDLELATAQNSGQEPEGEEEEDEDEDENSAPMEAKVGQAEGPTPASGAARGAATFGVPAALLGAAGGALAGGRKGAVSGALKGGLGVGVPAAAIGAIPGAIQGARGQGFGQGVQAMQQAQSQQKYAEAEKLVAVRFQVGLAKLGEEKEAGLVTPFKSLIRGGVRAFKGHGIRGSLKKSVTGKMGGKGLAAPTAAGAKKLTFGKRMGAVGRHVGQWAKKNPLHAMGAAGAVGAAGTYAATR